jgi:hypothetical protein
MFELANRLVGIYKTNDTTKSVTINPHCFENAVAGRNANSAANEETVADGVSSSPAPKKLKQNKKLLAEEGESHREEENGNRFSSKLNQETESRRVVLGDSTNKIA